MNDQYTAAVHEHMTLSAIREYRGDGVLERNPRGWKYQYMIEPPWQKEAGGQLHQTHAIIYGSWWNDDPLMRTWGQGSDFLGGVYGDWRFLQSGRKKYPGGTASCEVNADQHLGRWSHFGTLQHLHFMTDMDAGKSSAAQRVSSTTDRALTWMAFAYAVATGELAPDQGLTPEIQSQAGLPSIAQNLCRSPSSVHIRDVFSRIGWTKSYRDKVSPDVALGSMLHVLQDSWSPAHTCRIEQSGKGPLLVAGLRDVENYSAQIAVKGGEKRHSTLDQYPQWLVDEEVHGRKTYENDPIVTGAWLLDAVDKKLPWSEVEAHLRGTIFVLADPASSANQPCIQALARQ